MPRDDIRFARLTEVPLPTLLAQMSDPRVTRHLPLLTAPWTLETAREFVATKEARWQQDGLGHWAFFAGGEYAGWGGFEREGDEWDFGMVLTPAYFGTGMAIARQALDFAQSDARIPFVTFRLPTTRRNLGALQRLGAHKVSDVNHQGIIFRKFRLDTRAE